MTTEADPIGERLRPRIVETGDTGRLDLSLPAIPEPSLAPPPVRPFPSAFGVAMALVWLVQTFGIDYVAMGAIAAVMLVPMIRADFEKPRPLTPEQWLQWVRSGRPTRQLSDLREEANGLGELGGNSSLLRRCWLACSIN